MNLSEQLDYAEYRLSEAKRRNDDIEREYWLGYIDGLRAAVRKGLICEDLSDGALD